MGIREIAYQHYYQNARVVNVEVLMCDFLWVLGFWIVAANRFGLYKDLKVRKDWCMKKVIVSVFCYVIL